MREDTFRDADGKIAVQAWEEVCTKTLKQEKGRTYIETCDTQEDHELWNQMCLVWNSGPATC